MSRGPTSVTAYRSPAARPATTLSAGDAPRAGEDVVGAKSKGAPIIIATINPLVGDTGVQTHTRALNEGLAAAGVASAIQTPFSWRAMWLPIFGLRKVFGPLNRSWSTRWYRHWHAAALSDALTRRVRSQSAAAILAQCPVSAGVALDVRKRLGLDYPVAMVCHFNFSEAREYREKGELSDEASYQAILDYEQYVLGAVDRVIYVSGWARRIVEEERKIAVRNSSIIWNGVSASAGLAPLSRADIGLEPSDLVLMNVGTLEKRKNQAGLVDLFAEISKETPAARLVLVGDGPQRNEVRARIHHHGLEAKVRMLGMRRDVPALLPAADLYVHYAALENCPVVLIEAARAGLPIAALPSGGVPELLAAIKGVALDPDSNSTSLNILRPLLNDASARRVAGDATKAAFERAFTREAMVRAYLEAMQIPRPEKSEVAP